MLDHVKFGYINLVGNGEIYLFRHGKNPSLALEKRQLSPYSTDSLHSKTFLHYTLDTLRGIGRWLKWNFGKSDVLLSALFYHFFAGCVYAPKLLKVLCYKIFSTKQKRVGKYSLSFVAYSLLKSGLSSPLLRWEVI